MLGYKLTHLFQECPFSFASLVLPPGWVTGSNPEPASPAYTRHDGVHFRHGQPSVFLPVELNLRRLEVVEKYLWLAGRPMPARPLHAQLTMNRSIMLTEQLDMHLLWQDQRMFLKPLPRYLLQPAFWHEHLICREKCSCVISDGMASNFTCGTADLRSIALGFLLSWVSLVQYESDLRIAQEAHLLPLDMSWSVWHGLVSQLIPFQDHRSIHRRWIYGELRMHRINLMYRFVPRLPGGSLMRGYRSSFREYKSYVEYAFASFVGVFGVLSIILNAFQVGLTTDRLSSSADFQNASEGFAVFSILGIIVALLLLFVGLLVNFLFNLHATLRFRASRKSILKAEMP